MRSFGDLPSGQSRFHPLHNLTPNGSAFLKLALVHPSSNFLPWSHPSHLTSLYSPSKHHRAPLFGIFHKLRQPYCDPPRRNERRRGQKEERIRGGRTTLTRWTAEIWRSRRLVRPSVRRVAAAAHTRNFPATLLVAVVMRAWLDLKLPVKVRVRPFLVAEISCNL